MTKLSLDADAVEKETEKMKGWGEGQASDGRIDAKGSQADLGDTIGSQASGFEAEDSHVAYDDAGLDLSASNACQSAS